MVAGPQASELLGHGETLSALRKLAGSDSLCHALLVTGPDGIGKTSFALVLAADLLCLSPSQQGCACRVCRSCELARAGSHPDLLRVSPPKEETTIAQVRELRYIANLVPSLSMRRIIIIERAETLNDQAANAILKVLEDAPERLLIILLAPATQSVLGTVRSRSLHIPLRPVRNASLAKYLVEMKGTDVSRAEELAAYAGGVPGKAISLCDNDELYGLIGEVSDWLENLTAAEPGEALKMAEQLKMIAGRAKKHLPGEDGATDRQAVAWALDALTAKIQSAVYEQSETDFGSGKIAARWGAERLASMIASINETRRLILAYAQSDLMLERMVIRFLVRL